MMINKVCEMYTYLYVLINPSSKHTHYAEHDPLFYLVYERMAVVMGSLEPHLWSYRPHITLEHLTRYMQQQKMKFPILKEFLKQVRLP